MDNIIRVWCTLLLLLFLCTKVTSYEKTLRKIVRNQFKLEKRPFSELSVLSSPWKRSSLSTTTFPLEFVEKPHKSQKHKIPTMLSLAEGNKGTSVFSRKKFLKPDVQETGQTFSSAVTNKNSSIPTKLKFAENNLDQKADTNNLTIKNYYEIPAASKFFSPIFENDNSLEQKNNNLENTIVIPKTPDTTAHNETGALEVKGILIPKSQIKSRNSNFDEISPSVNKTHKIATVVSEVDNFEYVVERMPVVEEIKEVTANHTAEPLSCAMVRGTFTDIDAQKTFAQFNLEPKWTVNKHYWNKVFDSRYESLMRNPQWPPLQVILIPRVHVDTIWKKTFEQYYRESVESILSNIVKKLQFYEGLTFSWNEVSHLSHWWRKTTDKNRKGFRKLVKEGRLEITTGGWVETDEATTHLFGLVHQLIEGHQWLQLHLNYTPKVAWLTNTVTHSPTMLYLLSTLNIHHVVMTNIHYVWERHLAEFQYSDFVWTQNWDNDRLFPSKLNEDLKKIGNDRFPKHSALTHILPFNSAGFKACGPKGELCRSEFNFAIANKNLDINPYNIKDKAEQLLEQYSKTGTISLHNTIIAPIGGPYHYETQTEFDYQYNNYWKILDFINTNGNIYKASLNFGTTQDYFKAIINKHKRYPSLQGDFLNFADLKSSVPAYWTGFYTSRPFTKILLRRLQASLRTTEMLFSFALNFNVFKDYNLAKVFELLLKARETVARLSDRNVVSGTVTANILKYVHKLILSTVKDCWLIQELTASFLIQKPELKSPKLQKYVYKDGEFMSAFRSISPGDQICVFNSLSHERTEVVEIVTRYPNIRVLDRNKRELVIQINPIWKVTNNIITLSRRFYKVSFPVVVAPLTLALFKIKETFDSSHNAASLYCLSCVIEESLNSAVRFPFTIQPIQSGDIQLESFKQRLIFDEFTGFLKTVIEKETNIEKTIVIDYGAFKDAHYNSGIFLFKTNASNPMYDILSSYKKGLKTNMIFIISGQLTTELVTIYGNLLQHTTKIFNLVSSPLSNAIYIESKIDYDFSPNNRELEMFLSIRTDINNGNPAQMFTDNNSFQHTARYINISNNVESNMYPITSMAFIEDKWHRLTYMTDHAQGVTALQEGQIIVMLDRRVLYNDDRGTNEGLADSSATCHRHYILLESVGEPSGISCCQIQSQDELTLPSLNALYLTNTLSYLLDVFVIEKNNSEVCHYAYLPLIKTPFPCDVSLLNYRANLNKNFLLPDTLNSALMILHRQSYSCKVLHSPNLNCHGDSFILDKTLRNIKAAYLTNLAGTIPATRVNAINRVNFPPMELMTLRITF